ncbi:MAG: prepilin-type N-terminal cleavage/methylation domain-containing protein [Methylotenera sp.]|nr:prepilin-type N-terminal cleavage/methylation domain-containing protein [Oligoflexia bacterium]
MLKSSQSGFTLVEILIAMAVMAIGSLGIAEMLNNHNKAARNLDMGVARSGFKSAITGMIQNPANCLKIVGAENFNNFNAPNSSIRDPYKDISVLRGLTAGSTLVTAGQPLPGNSKLIAGQIRVEETVAPGPPVNGITKRQVRLIIPITKAGMANGERNIAGDSFLSDITIPMTLGIQANGTLDGCSPSATGCESENSVVTGDGRCKQVACPTGKIQAGVYSTAVTDADGLHQVGDVVCARISSHPAGLVDGNPKSCDRGYHLDNTGQCVNTTICPGQVQKSVASDGASYCCVHLSANSPGSSNDAQFNCPAGTNVEDAFGGAANSNAMRYVRVVGTTVEASCESSSGCHAEANCCRQYPAPFPTVISPRQCDTANHFAWDTGQQACVHQDPAVCPPGGFTASSGMCNKSVAHAAQCNCTGCSFSADPNPSNQGGECNVSAHY